MAINIQELETRRFFERPADIVVSELSARVYEKDGDQVQISDGQAKIIQVDTPEGAKNYRITSAEAYFAREATRIWKGRRSAEINALAPGEAITYRSRSGELTFIKTVGADNILLRGLEDTESGQRLNNPTEVSQALGLTHRQEGRLSLVEQDRFRFVRI